MNHGHNPEQRSHNDPGPASEGDANWRLSHEHFAFRLAQYQETGGEPSDVLLALAESRCALARQRFAEDHPERSRAAWDLTCLYLQREDVRYSEKALRVAAESLVHSTISNTVEAAELAERTSTYALLAVDQNQFDVALDAVSETLRLHTLAKNSDVKILDGLCARYWISVIAQKSAKDVKSSLLDVFARVDRVQDAHVQSAVATVCEAGVILLRRGKVVPALDLLEPITARLVESEPTDKILRAQVLHQVTLTYAYARHFDSLQLERSLETLQLLGAEALSNAPVEPGLAYAVAEIAMDHGVFDVAAELFPKAVGTLLDNGSLDSESQSSLTFNAALAFEKAGKINEAMDLFTKSLHILADSESLSMTARVQLIGRNLHFHLNSEHDQLVPECLETLLRVVGTTEHNLRLGKGSFVGHPDIEAMCEAALLYSSYLQHKNFQATAVSILTRTKDTLDVLENRSELHARVNLEFGAARLEDGRLEEAAAMTAEARAILTQMDNPPIAPYLRSLYQGWRVAVEHGEQQASLSQRVSEIHSLCASLTDVEITRVGEQVLEIADGLLTAGFPEVAKHLSWQLTTAVSELNGDIMLQVFASELCADAWLKIGSTEQAKMQLSQLLSEVQRRNDVPPEQRIRLNLKLISFDTFAGEYKSVVERTRRLIAENVDFLSEHPIITQEVTLALARSYRERGLEIEARQAIALGESHCPDGWVSMSLNYQRATIDTMLAFDSLVSLQEMFDRYFATVDENFADLLDPVYEDLEGRVRLGEFYLLRDDYHSARKTYSSILEAEKHVETAINPDTYFRRCYIGVALAEHAGEPEKGVPLIADALRFYEQRYGDMRSLERVKIFMKRAALFEKVNDPDRAIQSYRLGEGDLERMGLQYSAEMLQLLKEYASVLSRHKTGSRDAERLRVSERLSVVEAALKV